MTLQRQVDSPGGLTKGQILIVACGRSYLGIPAEVIRGIARPEQAGSSSEGGHPPVDLAARFGLVGSSVSPETRILLCGARGAQGAPFREGSGGG